MSTPKPKRSLRWSASNVLTEALLFPTVRLWEVISPKSVTAARRLGVYDLCCRVITLRHFETARAGVSLEHGVTLETLLKTVKVGHRVAGRRGRSDDASKRRVWDLESIIKTTLGYESFPAWRATERAAYQAAKRRGYIHILSRLLGGNRTVTRTPPKDLSDDALRRAADDTGARTWRDLQSESPGVYAELRRRVLADGIETKFGLPRGPSWSRRWSELNVYAVAKTVTSLRMLERLSPGAAAAARRLGILADIRRQFFTQTRAGAKLTIADCMDSAAGYQSMAEWVDGDRQAAIRATRRGWLKDCCHHFS